MGSEHHVDHLTTLNKHPYGFAISSESLQVGNSVVSGYCVTDDIASGLHLDLFQTTDHSRARATPVWVYVNQDQPLPV